MRPLKAIGNGLAVLIALAAAAWPWLVGTFFVLGALAAPFPQSVGALLLIGGVVYVYREM